MVLQTLQETNLVLYLVHVKSESSKVAITNFNRFRDLLSVINMTSTYDPVVPK